MAALIAYYSRAGENYFGGAYRRIAVGNTEKAANMLAELTGGELYKIEQEQPYSEDYKTCIAEAKADLQKKARPEVLNLPDDLDAYDEIYLGYPNYWGTMLMARRFTPSARTKEAAFPIPYRTFRKPRRKPASPRVLPFMEAAWTERKQRLKTGFRRFTEWNVKKFGSLCVPSRTAPTGSVRRSCCSG